MHPGLATSVRHAGILGSAGPVFTAGSSDLTGTVLMVFVLVAEGHGGILTRRLLLWSVLFWLGRWLNPLGDL